MYKQSKKMGWGLAFFLIAFTISFVFNFWPIHKYIINPIEDHYQFGERIRSDTEVHYRSFLSIEPVMVLIGLLTYAAIGVLLSSASSKISE